MPIVEARVSVKSQLRTLEIGRVGRIIIRRIGGNGVRGTRGRCIQKQDQGEDGWDAVTATHVHDGRQCGRCSSDNPAAVVSSSKAVISRPGQPQFCEPNDGTFAQMILFLIDDIFFTFGIAASSIIMVVISVPLPVDGNLATHYYVRVP